MLNEGATKYNALLILWNVMKVQTINDIAL